MGSSNTSLKMYADRPYPPANCPRVFFFDAVMEMALAAATVLRYYLRGLLTSDVSVKGAAGCWCPTEKGVGCPSERIS